MKFNCPLFSLLGTSLLLMLASYTRAQSLQQPSAPSERNQAYQWRNDSVNAQLAGNWSCINIGPTIMNGRITDIDVNPLDAHEFYIAYASGGLWHTQNNGTTFQPIFEHEAVMTIGDIAVHWPSRTIYVGTGENNSSRSSYAGNGIYRSTDNGKTWKNLGLSDTHHIGRLWVDVKDENKIMVAALGHLYSKNPERGIFKSEDGGKTWSQPLFVNDSTGVIDLIADPIEKNTFYCSSWQRQRTAWNFSGAGQGSAIYKSTDGGRTWTKMTEVTSGFPAGAFTGRIGLTASTKNNQTVLFAIVDNQETRESKVEKKQGLTKEVLKTMSVDTFLKLDDAKIESYLRANDFPEKYDAKEVKKLLKKGEIEVKSLVEYLEDANNVMFEAEIKGAEVYTSNDGGVSWKKTHEGNLDGLYYTYGYYFGQISAQPEEAEVLYILGVPLLKSTDAGKTWKNINGDNQHGDHHVLWVNPANSRHIINGNDGGLNISYDGGESWVKCTMPAVGQFYAVQTDSEEPYNVYGGLQDNGVWMGKSNYKYSAEWQSDGVYPYKSLLGGDGMQVQVDPRDNNTVYTGFQFGNYFRIDVKSGKRKNISPKHNLGERPYRFNWQTPILLSRHQPEILYMGANKFLRSLDKGDHFKAISEDLTAGGKPGNVPFGTLTAIDESPLEFGLLYSGSDDGLVYVSKDGGNHWQDISKGLPASLWVSRIVASQYKKSRVYVSLNGYRNDDFTPYLYVSDDFGMHWRSMGDNLPHEAINVLREDTEDEKIIFVGTDHGVYFSINGGHNFQQFSKSLPNVAVHDLAIHKKANEMIIGTHGRSLFKTDIAPIRKLKDLKDTLFTITSIETINFRTNWGKKINAYSEVKQPIINILYFAQNAEKALLSISSENGLVRFNKEIDLGSGLNRLEIPFWFEKKPIEAKVKSGKNKKESVVKTEPEEMADDGHFYPKPGKYAVTIKSEKFENSASFQITNKK
jgi:photosystem II stability/assembly factor-like uncharacterized protein